MSPCCCVCMCLFKAFVFSARWSKKIQNSKMRARKPTPALAHECGVGYNNAQTPFIYAHTKRYFHNCCSIKEPVNWCKSLPPATKKVSSMRLLLSVIFVLAHRLGLVRALVDPKILVYVLCYDDYSCEQGSAYFRNHSW